MYKIEKKDYGFKILFKGTIDIKEVKEWIEESKTLLKENGDKKFCVFGDIRALNPLLDDAQKAVQEGQKLFKKGLLRSVVVLNNAAVTLQFKRIAMESGVSDTEKYIDASSVPDWEEKALAWVRDAVDPDENSNS